ncbi:MAG TPA: class I SAM-dependent methyltransferase [Gammaproteobacteria bacterium]|nr:class I SAM-dependent methyltransferase [Gammaproteobacteria bacterium]
MDITSAEKFSFREILNKGGKRHGNYVLSRWRYRGLLDFLCEHVPDSRRGRVVDLGCGGGVISRGLATVFNEVIGVDVNPDNVELARSIARDAGIANVSYRGAHASRLPIEDASVDLVVVNGVLEWVGVNDDGNSPRQMQLRVLREVGRILRPGGTLYLAIENRWHPGTLLRDPHSGLRWVNALPRPLANMVSHRKANRPFQTWIYGWRSLRQLVAEAGFSVIKPYVPFTGYQFPRFYVAAHSREAALSDIDRIDVMQVTEVLEEAGRPMNVPKAARTLRRRAKWGALRLLAHDLVLVCTKP